MLSAVLNSPQAVAVSVAVIRAFVRIRQLMASHTDLVRRIDALEERYDGQFAAVFDALRQLLDPPESSKRSIGFHS